MRYNLAIIGGGPAGYSAALEAVENGFSVVLFEKNQIGGTCLNRGCVPTKYLRHTAKLFTQMHNSSKYGIGVENIVFNYEKAFASSQEIIRNLRVALEKQIRMKRIDIIEEKAIILTTHEIQAGEKIYKCDNILVATGSKPAQIFIEGAVSSDELLLMSELPQKIKIMGGGVVAVEFAWILRTLGVDVSIYIRGERILRKWDKELAIGITQILKHLGVHIYTKYDFSAVNEENNCIILQATGRIANLEGVRQDLIDIGQDGGILVDFCGEAKTAGIFAAGDVVSGSPMLAHVGMEQGKRVVRHLAGKEVEKQNAIISCIYVDIEVVSVGITEQMAKEKQIEIISAKQVMQSNARTMIETETRSFIKILAERKSGRILGAQLMCENAGELVAELALAINKRLTVEDMLGSTRPHPSFCEVITETLEILRNKCNAL